ncbi:MAG: hypothetical protein IPL95_02990 [Saprospiraceae bacterium]|nr:hypothetical protein [Saprospiraceae bacterium]
MFENTISINGGIGEKTNMSAIVSHTKQNGYIPNSSFERFNVSVGGTSQLTSKFALTSNLSFSNTLQHGPLLGGDNPASLFARTLYMGRSWPSQDMPTTNPANNSSVFFVSSAQADNPL